MEEGNWREYLKSERKKYKKLRSIKCPAFGGEEIHFNRYGFDHTVYKSGIPRPMNVVLHFFSIMKE